MHALVLNVSKNKNQALKDQVNEPGNFIRPNCPSHLLEKFLYNHSLTRIALWAEQPFC